MEKLRQKEKVIVRKEKADDLPTVDFDALVEKCNNALVEKCNEEMHEENITAHFG